MQYYRLVVVFSPSLPIVPGRPRKDVPCRLPRQHCAAVGGAGGLSSTSPAVTRDQTDVTDEPTAGVWIDIVIRGCYREMCVLQGRRHEILCGGAVFMGTQTNLPPKLVFSSDFGHFILNMLDHAKLLYLARKKLLKYQ